jgi:peptide/nickel transport system permease protein
VTDTAAPRALALLRAALRTRGSKAAAAVLLLFVLIAVFARYIAPFDPTLTPEIIGGTNLPPSAAHLFGTDPFSRDVLSRVIWGAQISLSVAAGSVLLAVTLGAAWGAVAGFAGGWLDSLLMRVVDTVLSVPRLLLLIVLVASRSESLSVGGIILLLGLTGWPATSRIVRAEVRALRGREFVLAARAIGVPAWRILLVHVMPGVVPQILVAATLAFATVIPLEAGLAFLGLGVPIPTPSWGNIIRDGAEHPEVTWWLVFFPGLAIVCTVLAVNAIGDRLREAADPRQLPLR